MSALDSPAEACGVAEAEAFSLLSLALDSSISLIMASNAGLADVGFGGGGGGAAGVVGLVHVVSPVAV